MYFNSAHPPIDLPRIVVPASYTAAASSIISFKDCEQWRVGRRK
jgi:hypothetical protein